MSNILQIKNDNEIMKPDDEFVSVIKEERDKGGIENIYIVELIDDEGVCSLGRAANNIDSLTLLGGMINLMEAFKVEPEDMV